MPKVVDFASVRWPALACTLLRVKNLAILGLVVLAFFIWWPLGAAGVLVWIWSVSKTNEGRARLAEQHTISAMTQARETALVAENRALQHERSRREIASTGDRIHASVDSLLEAPGAKNPTQPEYHAWNIIGDTVHDLEMLSLQADYENCELALSVLQYLDAHAQDLVSLVIKDPRWKLFDNRELDFDDFRKMTGLAHVCTTEALNLITKGAFGALVQKRS
jgi:hypothetical protein